MNPFVNVSSDEDGNVIVPTKNNNGYIRLTQERMIINKKGWLNVKPVSTLVQGEIEMLEKLEWKANQQLKGHIVVKESLEPFNTNNPERDYKIAGETGVVCCVDGQPIYRKTFYDLTGQDTDELIEHTNQNEIRKAAEELNVIANELDRDFSL